MYLKSIESNIVSDFYRKFIDLLTFELGQIQLTFELDLLLQEMYLWHEFGDSTSNA